MPNEPTNGLFVEAAAFDVFAANGGLAIIATPQNARTLSRDVLLRTNVLPGSRPMTPLSGRESLQTVTSSGRLNHFTRHERSRTATMAQQ